MFAGWEGGPSTRTGAAGQAFPTVEERIGGEFSQAVVFEKREDIHLVPLSPKPLEHLSGFGMQRPTAAQLSPEVVG